MANLVVLIGEQKQSLPIIGLLLLVLDPLMLLKYTTYFIGFVLAISLLACTDHRLGGALSPSRFRLRTVTSSLNTTYTYDNQNRLATISKSSGVLSVFAYDDIQKYADLKQFSSAADQTTGIRITFPYSFPNKDFTSTIYSFFSTNPYNYNQIDQTSYRVDPLTPSHIQAVTRYLNSSQQDVRVYAYTGDNITTGRFTLGRVSEGTKTYEYDGKINPFFGSTDPDLDDIQRFSRNNVVKITSSYPPIAGGYPDQVITYQYEYNQQGLPTKRTTVEGGRDVATYGYESY